MLKTHLILGTYNHLPEGLDDNAFERTYQTCYRPFLSVLNRFPEIQAALYYSGSLLKRLESLHPEYLMLLEEMSARRQIELLGGGFYAPLLPLIPASDRLGQIELLTTYLRKSFGKRPRGCWLAEYAWEPWLASTLQASGMDYTLLLDRQFREASGRADVELAPVVTEDQGRCLTVLPVRDCSSSFGEPCGLVEAAEASEPCALTVLMLQGEQIERLWEASGLESPDLYMERTFAWFRRNALEAETTTPSRYLKTRRVTSRLYFPGSASTRFLQAIAAPGSSAACPSLRAAIVRYASASALYSRMHYVHLLIGQLRGDKSRKKTAVEDLWKGQCGDAYWLSPSGGIDHPSIRETAYRSLIDAEMTTRQKAVFAPGIVRADVDFDGGKEYIYQGTELNAYIHAKGAVITELDALKARRNLCDIFDDMPLETSRKQCFVDRLYAEAPDVDRVVSPWHGDIGHFSRHHYDESVVEDQQPSISFIKDGVVGIGGGKRSIAITKRYTFNRKTVKVSYGIQNRSDVTANVHFGVELNLTLGPEPLEAIVADAAQLDPSGLCSERGVALGTPARLMMRGNGPVKTISVAPSIPAQMSAATIGIAASQGTSVLLVWPIELAADATWTAEILLSIQE